MALADFIYKKKLLRKFCLIFLYKTAGFWPDKYFLKLYFHIRNGVKINLNNPLTFTEKLNWLKLNEIRSDFQYLVDKYEVKRIVNEKLQTEEYTIPTIGVWNSYDEIDFSQLPKEFVLKTTNGGGNSAVVVVTDKEEINHDRLRKKLKLSKSKPRYLWSREYPYYKVRPRIIAEKLISAANGQLNDYKFFCFNGEPKFLFVSTDRNIEGEDVKFDFFDINFNHLPITNGHATAHYKPIKPQNYGKMVEIATKLSSGLKHVRVDLYNVDGKIYFGEYTLFHFAGMVPIEPREWDIKFGEYLNIE